MREIISVSTQKREELIDITPEVRSVVERSGVNDGLLSVYVQGATAAIMIQLLQNLAPRGVWLHDSRRLRQLTADPSKQWTGYH